MGQFHSGTRTDIKDLDGPIELSCKYQTKLEWFQGSSRADILQTYLGQFHSTTRTGIRLDQDGSTVVLVQILHYIGYGSTMILVQLFDQVGTSPQK